MSGSIKLGYFDSCTYTPEELILAADLIPVRLFGSQAKASTLVDTYVQSHFCPFARSCLDLALKGFYADFAGVVISHGCDITNQFYDLWKKHVNLGYLYYLHVPLTTEGETAKKFFINELTHFKSSLEELVGKEITQDDLQRSIELCNETREWLRKISELRKKDPPLVSGTELHKLVRMSQTTAKEEVNEILRRKYNELSHRDLIGDRKPRILLSGSIIDDSALIRFIEDLGISVVADDLCVGSRYYWTSIDVTRDPLHDIATRYLTKPILSAKVPREKRLEYLRTLIKKYQVEGVMLHQLKFCDSYHIDNVTVHKVLQAADVPVLVFETSYTLTGRGQLRTRVEAFIELLQKTES
ncbi:MAG: 2-hydroxyacyl-CoA dehydratase subunit D [Candidatus Heimdallarchaeota archaeon]